MAKFKIELKFNTSTARWIPFTNISSITPGYDVSYWYDFKTLSGETKRKTKYLKRYYTVVFYNDLSLYDDIFSYAEGDPIYLKIQENGGIVSEFLCYAKVNGEVALGTYKDNNSDKIYYSGLSVTFEKVEADIFE